MRRSRPHAAGFTLIEAIMSIVILSISVPAMLFAVRNAGTQRVSPMMASTARWLATEKLEDVIADAHSSTRGYTYVLTGNYPTENPVASFTGYTRSVTVTETAADLISAGTGYKRVVVSVSWTDANATVRTLNLTTVVTSPT